MPFTTKPKPINHVTVEDDGKGKVMIFLNGELLLNLFTDDVVYFFTQGVKANNLTYKIKDY